MLLKKLTEEVNRKKYEDSSSVRITPQVLVKLAFQSIIYRVLYITKQNILLALPEYNLISDFKCLANSPIINRC